MLRMCQKARRISKQEHINWKDAASLLSSMGWVEHTDTYRMYEDRIKPYVSIRKLKKVVSKYQRRVNNERKLQEMRGNTGTETLGS